MYVIHCTLVNVYVRGIIILDGVMKVTYAHSKREAMRFDNTQEAIKVIMLLSEPWQKHMTIERYTKSTH